MYDPNEYNNNSTEERREETIYSEADRLRAEEYKAKKQQAKKTRGKFWLAAGLGLTFGVLAAVSFKTVDIIGKSIQSRFMPDTVKTEASSAKENEAGSKEAESEEIKKDTKDATKTAANSSTVTTVYDVTAVVKEVMPSVVSITNKSVQEVRSMFGYGVQQYQSESAGSGIIIGENEDEYLIITNNHVVEGAVDLTVGFVDDEVVQAEVKGTDPGDDLAVIAVKKADVSEDTKKAISIAEIGDSDALAIGEPVVAIGNALGYGQSVTSGIVSALNRELTIDNVTYTLIQTDAAINPGNSGGALLNMDGQVIGINSAKLASSKIEGIGYAIPISSAIPIFEELMNRSSREIVEEADMGYLGIASNIEVPQDYASALGIPEGVYITEVTKDSPAEKAGLLKSDVIKKFDGLTVTSISDLKNQLKYYKAGEEVEILVLRLEEGEYKEKTITLTLGSREGTELDPARNKSIEENKESQDQNNKDPRSNEQNDPDKGGQNNQEIPEEFGDFPGNDNSKGFYFNFGNGEDPFGYWGFGE
ncbi:MAG: trypsin-like peptidase domain-containing protein [Lachnospiraceae bacterium]|nr:trypsin-like peptidase domain-containing protein [Lachnospiraceae bacterium]